MRGMVDIHEGKRDFYADHCAANNVLRFWKAPMNIAEKLLADKWFWPAD